MKIILKNDFIHLNIHFSEAALPAVLACMTPMFVTLCHDYNTYSHVAISIDQREYYT